MNVRGKTAIVTGGASGLGAATARLLHREGANVVILDRNEDAGHAVTHELGDRVRFVKTDVSDGPETEGAVKQAVEEYGGLHIAVNCAGIGDPQKVVDKEGPASLERFSKVIRVNLIGTFNVCRLAAAAILQNEPNSDGERGVIVNTASVAAFDGQIGQAAYTASKAGIAGMTLPLARDLSRSGIRVMTIAPGIFDTPMLAALPENVRVALGAMVPFPARLGRPEEYAMLVRHIIENPMLNGEVIRLDGAIRMARR
ncbi:MAG: 3-hydroxyacyl-CoA dehydrogenase [Acidobacteriaceae bacterium]|nr:3-hydroxyacyl-CoA dehydrogenase [Acidobacteriaceae bacterium]